MFDKCSTCRLRYVCEEQAEFECRRRDFRDYVHDDSLKGFATTHAVPVDNCSAGHNDYPSGELALIRWVPVDERLPNDEELANSPFYTFLVASSGEVKEAVYNTHGKYFSKNGRLWGVTHWSCMPSAPVVLDT